jgi:antitoxin component YwqK of YwqJK toxin-antitoxin module
MVQKAHLLFSLIVFCSINCKNNKEDATTVSSLLVDTTMIPKDTILVNQANLQLNNGVYFWDKKPFSGYIKENYDEKRLKSIGSYWQGKQEGTTLTFYENGKNRDNRSYKNGLAFGKHLGFWQNGNQKFDFTYVNEQREGEQKQWYENGKSYSFLRFKNDKEDGMQHAWRENGKPYINYEVKDGHRYGLQKAALCYTLKDGKIK